MTARVLITNAGRGASNSLIRSLRASDVVVSVVGCNDDRFILKNSDAERNYLVPPASHPRRISTLRRILKTEKIDLLIPVSDEDVTELSRARRRLRDHLFLPRPGVIALCQDKYRLSAFLRAKRIPAPLTYRLTSLGDLAQIFRRLRRARSVRAWCRIRSGAGALGAAPVASAAQAARWVAYWRDMRGASVRAFTLSEYLPGRDFGCQSVWKDGELILVKTYERLSYLAGGGRPAEVSSVAALAKTVFEPAVVKTCTSAIRALDRTASGVFSVDLKEDAAGVACVTEINAGRFSSATNVFDLAGKHNMAGAYVRAALGEPPDNGDPYDVVEDHYMLRDVDALPKIFRGHDIFDAILEPAS